jgi:hypothetical protein
MQNASLDDGWVALKGVATPADIRRLQGTSHINKLSVTESPRLTARIAEAFSSLESVAWLWLWCDVTRTAMRHVVSISGLRVLDVLNITKPGRLEGFSSAITLEAFRGNHFLTEPDLFEVITCKSLREVGAQGAALSVRVLDALLRLPALERLDLEGTSFDDSMAEHISASKVLSSLDVGATRITRAGLSHLCKMGQLRSLDLWATGIEESDLDLLAHLPNLEYLSVGDVEGQSGFNAESLLRRLEAIPSLKRVWLDGVPLSEAQKATLESRYSYVRIT